MHYIYEYFYILSTYQATICSGKHVLKMDRAVAYRWVAIVVWLYTDG
jgi:hypothetical protein